MLGNLDSDFALSGILLSGLESLPSGSFQGDSNRYWEPPSRDFVFAQEKIWSGASNGNSIARFNVDGSADNTFNGGTNVLNLADVPGFASYGINDFSFVIDSDGRIVLSLEDSVARLLGNGSLDTSFGQGGIVSFGFESPLESVDILLDELNDGSYDIVVAGSLEDSSRGVQVVRFNEDGSLDSTASTDFQGVTSLLTVAIALDPSASDSVGNNRVVLGTDFFSIPNDPSELLGLARYNATDLSLDSSFGSGGTTVISNNPPGRRGIRARLADVIVDSGGEIFVAGGDPYDEDSNTADASVQKFTAAGNIDISFGRTSISDIDGIAQFGLNSSSDAAAFSIALDSQENLIVGTGSGLASLDNDTGSIQASIANVLGNSSSQEAVVNNVLIDSAGGVLVQGSVQDSSGNNELVIARYEGEEDLSSPPNASTSSDFNGDGQNDLLLYNPELQFSGIGFMDGENITGSAALWTGWKPAAKGDFNNDGQTDIVVENLANDWHGILYMNGPNIQSSQGISGWAGWDIVGAGNFNNDGTDDILIKHQTEDWYGVWYMGGSDGSEIQSSQGINMWSGWDVKGAGDFNGDGKAELVAQHQTEDWYGLLELDSNQQIVNSQAIAGWAGWDIVGTSDQNEDGQTDLLIQNRVEGWQGAWFMSGNQITGSQGLNVWQGWEAVG